MTPNLYQILTAQFAADARRQEFHAACRRLCHPALLVAYGVAMGAVLAAVCVAVAK